MGLYRLVYVSRSTLPAAEAEDIVRSIVETSQQSNELKNITGALLFTGEAFAQALEGEEADIKALMESVSRDPRHEDVIVGDGRPLVQRHFGNWGMGYWGRTQHASNLISEVRTSTGSAERFISADRLMRFMKDAAHSAARTAA